MGCSYWLTLLAVSNGSVVNYPSGAETSQNIISCDAKPQAQGLRVPTGLASRERSSRGLLGALAIEASTSGGIPALVHLDSLVYK